MRSPWRDVKDPRVAFVETWGEVRPKALSPGQHVILNAVPRELQPSKNVLAACPVSPASPLTPAHTARK